MSFNQRGRPRGPNARVRLIDINRGLMRLSQKIELLEERVTSFANSTEQWIDLERRGEDREDR